MPKIGKIFFCLFTAGFIFFGHEALAFSVGEKEVFNVDAFYDFFNRSQVGATVLKIGEEAVYYVDDRWWQSQTNQTAVMAAIDDLSEEFDKRIYPQTTEVFGQEWSPGVDNEFKITILITQLQDTAGAYFNTFDEYYKSQYPSSNQREMVYLNGSFLSSVYLKTFLAHEFQHMISFYQKEKKRGLAEDLWLNEARSEYVSTLLGYDDDFRTSYLKRRLSEFLRDPENSLTEWEGKTEDCGAVSMFMNYLVGRFGEEILTKMVRADATGIASINQALADLGSKDKFEDIFADWLVASHLNNCSVDGQKKFCYANLNLSAGSLRASPSANYYLTVKNGTTFSFSELTKDWSGRWYKILPQSADASLNLVVAFSGEVRADFRVILVISNQDGSFSIRDMNLSDEKGEEIIIGFGQTVRSVTVIPFSSTKSSGFSSDEPSRFFSLGAKITASGTINSTNDSAAIFGSQGKKEPVAAPVPAFPDGTLIRKAGDFKVYIVKGNYKRWLQTPEIMAAYPHLSWQGIKEVTQAEFDYYQESSLVLAEGDFRVYEINGDLSKHWLNMSTEQFASSGRSWEMVYKINRAERDIYKTGANVTR